MIYRQHIKKLLNFLLLLKQHIFLLTRSRHDAIQRTTKSARFSDYHVILLDTHHCRNAPRACAAGARVMRGRTDGLAADAQTDGRARAAKERETRRSDRQKRSGNVNGALFAWVLAAALLAALRFLPLRLLACGEK